MVAWRGPQINTFHNTRNTFRGYSMEHLITEIGIRSSVSRGHIDILVTSGKPRHWQEDATTIVSHQGHGLRRAQAFDPPGAGRKAYQGIRLRPATPRAGAWARPEGRRCPADSVRHVACPMHHIALRAVPTLSAGQRRADHDPGEKCGLEPRPALRPGTRP